VCVWVFIQWHSGSNFIPIRPLLLSRIPRAPADNNEHTHDERSLAYSFCTKFAALFIHECDDKIFVTAIKHFMSVESENLVFQGAAFGRFRRLRFLRLGNRPRTASKSDPPPSLWLFSHPADWIMSAAFNAELIPAFHNGMQGAADGNGRNNYCFIAPLRAHKSLWSNKQAQRVEMARLAA
jgi:hypothetical protein